MEYAEQSLPKTFYNESKKWFCNTRCNRRYENLMKRHYHKVRREKDKQFVEDSLFDALAPDYSEHSLAKAGEIAGYDGPPTYIIFFEKYEQYRESNTKQTYGDIFNWKEHNHKQRICEH